ncbi:MAG TPA: 16S rRNA (uracil(1498)-N(3))-methyltransferase [Methylomirabilota bacterium]|nr:16S rRNA (uracil(1498)-N(3))-methyltransferase [Methylomirabilota bacterium]
MKRGSGSDPCDSGGRAPRLFVDADLRAGAAIRLADERAHYLRHVLRLEPGAPVDLFNGRDGEWRSALAAVAKGQATLTVERQLRPQTAGPDLWLVFAPIKRAPLDLVAAKATELGIAALQPVMTQHTAVDRVNLERLRAIAIEAAEQCERLDVPHVRDVVTLGELLAGWSPGRRLLLCAESGAAAPIAEALGSQADAAAAPWAVLIGPEGGFARSELDALRKLPFVMPVGLGPRILRADTAALAALACWQAILGDGQQRPPHRGST